MPKQAVAQMAAMSAFEAANLDLNVSTTSGLKNGKYLLPMTVTAATR